MNDDGESAGLEFVTSVSDVVLPTGLPVLPMFDLDARFCIPGDSVEPSGIWFDSLALPDDRLALVVGEVPGVGLAAAVTAAQMRAVLRAGLRRDGDAVDALQLADIHADDTPEARGTTAVVVLLDAERGIATYANAGHPPPWLLAATGSVQRLSDTGGGPLGTGSGTGYARATTAIAVGDGILLANAAAHPWVATLPADASGGLFRTPDELAEHVAAGEGVCVLTATLRDSPHRALDVSLVNGSDPVRRARDEVGTWLTEMRASSMDQMALTHAAAELVTNAVQHGAQGEDPAVDLRGRLGANGVVLIEILDHGVWQPPSGDFDQGRGLAMAAGLVDHLGVAIRPTGTRVFVQHRLSRPLSIETYRPPNGTASTNGKLEVVSTAPQAISLRGPFSHDDVDRVAAEILVASRGGTVRLSLDLTEVTQLSTSAVRLLTDLTSVNRAVGMYTADIHITSSASSAVERSLDLARVPHHAA